MRLPASARQKLEDLESAIREGHALMQTALSEIDLKRRQLTDAERVYETTHKEPDRAEAAEEVERLRGEITRLVRKRDDRGARLTSDKQTLSQVKRFLAEDARHRTLKPAQTRRIEYKKNETAEQALIRVRQEIVNLHNEVQEIERAPLPKDEIREKAADWIDACAERASPRLKGVLPVGPDGRFGIASFGLLFGRGDTAPQNMVDALCVFFPDRVRKVIDELVDELPDTDAPRYEERKERVAALRADLLSLERQEEFLVCRLLNDGVQVTRRPMADPRAILGVEFEQRARVAA